MVWGAIGWNFKSPLIFLRPDEGCRGITAKAYVRQVLEGYLSYAYPLRRMVDPRVFLVEDNAPVHGKKGLRTLANIARRDLDILSINWPPGSPDMNIIENVWRMIKQRIRKRKWKGGWVLEDLMRAVKEEWEAITFEDYKKYIEEMPERVLELRQRRGGQTRY